MANRLDGNTRASCLMSCPDQNYLMLLTKLFWLGFIVVLSPPTAGEESRCFSQESRAFAALRVTYRVLLDAFRNKS